VRWRILRRRDEPCRALWAGCGAIAGCRVYLLLGGGKPVGARAIRERRRTAINKLFPTELSLSKKPNSIKTLKLTIWSLDFVSIFFV